MADRIWRQTKLKNCLSRLEIELLKLINICHISSANFVIGDSKNAKIPNFKKCATVRHIGSAMFNLVGRVSADHGGTFYLHGADIFDVHRSVGKGRWLWLS